MNQCTTTLNCSALQQCCHVVGLTCTLDHGLCLRSCGGVSTASWRHVTVTRWRSRTHYNPATIGRRLERYATATIRHCRRGTSTTGRTGPLRCGQLATAAIGGWCCHSCRQSLRGTSTAGRAGPVCWWRLPTASASPATDLGGTHCQSPACMCDQT